MSSPDWCDEVLSCFGQPHWSCFSKEAEIQGLPGVGKLLAYELAQVFRI